MGQLQKAWTEEEDQELHRLKGIGCSWAEIGQELTRHPSSCRSHYQFITESPEKHELRLQRARKFKKRARQRNALLGTTAKGYTTESIVVPAELWADRDARLIEPRPLSAWLMGDPCPSRSALAQRGVA